jgi:hypothetical protein
MRDNNVDGDCGEVDGDGAEDTSPSRQGARTEILSPEICRWQRRSCGTSSRKLPIDLGFSVGRLYIGGEAASEGAQGAHTIGWRAPGVTHAALGCGRPLAPLRLSFGLHPLSGKNWSFSFCFI